MRRRGLLTIAILAAVAQPVGAQFGGMPGMPGGPPGGSPAETFREAPHLPPQGSPPPHYGPPPKCQALLSVRDELQQHGNAIRAANDKKADVRVACRLFRNYIATEAKMLRMLEADGAACGAGPQVIQQVRGSHAKAQQIGTQVCDAAARGPGPSGPTLRDALGTSSSRPTLYDVFGTPPAPPSPDQKPYQSDGPFPYGRRP